MCVAMVVVVAAAMRADSVDERLALLLSSVAYEAAVVQRAARTALVLRDV